MMKLGISRFLLLAGFSLLSLMMGCGDPDGRVPVEGTITLGGQPLDEGIIEFVSEGLRTGSVISEGKYAIPKTHGLTPGSYKVKITSGDGKTPLDAADDFIPGPTGANIVSKERIPPEYNSRSTQVVTVEGGKLNRFNYDIP
jgi:hypothetical protein